MMTTLGCQSTPPGKVGVDTVPVQTTKAPRKAPRTEATHRAGTRDLTPLLDEAELRLAEGDPYLAHVMLRGLDLAEADDQSAQRAASLRIESSIELGLLDESFEWLASPDLDPAEAARLRAELCEERGDDACVFRQLVTVAASSEQPGAFSDRIWNALTRAASKTDVSTLGADDLSAGWLALLNIVQRSQSLESEKAAWEAWKLSRPNHPAATGLPDALKYLESTGTSETATVAVLLPLSGQLQPIGRAVRDGLMSAHVAEVAASGEQAHLPTLRFYDAAATALPELKDRALSEGATLIVGPILRDGVIALANQAPPVPVIALNYIDTNAGGPRPPDFFQMGIAIEDEAKGIAELLNQKGYERLLFVVSSAGWAERALRQIRESWPHEPLVLRVQSAGEITGQVGGVLSSTPEFLRKTSIQTITGLPVVISPGKRHDVDAIVALTDPVQTSTLGPALTYHAFGRVDTYMGTQSFRSANDVSGLGSVTVSDLPVMLAKEGFDSTLRRSWLGQSAADISFFALGADAYRLLRRMPLGDAGSTRTLWGSSGLLLLGTDRTVRRVQTFGTFRNGVLQPLVQRD